MTWLSFDDGFTRQPVWDGMPYDTRWHFHAMVEFCGATRRYSGRLRLADALRCSDVPDPQRCLTELFAAGLVINMGGEVEVDDVDNYLPPEGQRSETLLPRKRVNQAAYRRKKCESGHHSRDCPPATCPVKLARSATRVTESVAGNAGTGRVGTGSTKTEGQVLSGTELEDGDFRGAPGDEVGGKRQPIAPSPQTGDGSINGVLQAQTIPVNGSAGASHQTVTRARTGRKPLPEPKRQTILGLHAQGGMTLAQIAEQAGVSKSTAHKVVHAMAAS